MAARNSILPKFEALIIPDDALARGGVEILRAAIIDGQLHVTLRRTFERPDPWGGLLSEVARRVFKDPATWGEILGEITQRLGRIYAAEGEYKAREVIAAIENAFAAEMGATPIAAPRRKRTKRKPAARKPARQKTGRAAKRSSRKAR